MIDFNFLFKPSIILFTFLLTLALLNMLGKILFYILRVIKTADYLKHPADTKDNQTLTKSYIKNLTDTSKILISLKGISRKSLLKYFFHLDKVQNLTALNIILFCFGLSGIYLSLLLTKFYDYSQFTNFILSFSSSLIITLVAAKVILFLLANTFPKFNADVYPKEKLLNLPAWVLRKKSNVYLCQVFEPCGQSFKVEVALPITDKQVKYRTPVILQKFNADSDCFEGDYISVDEAVRIFEKREKEVFIEVKQTSKIKQNFNL